MTRGRGGPRYQWPAGAMQPPAGNRAGEAPPPAAQPSADPLGDALVAAGLAPSAYIMGVNGTLAAPDSFRQELPWSLPSRLFRYPIEVSVPEPDAPRRLGLLHPLLADHPFVRHVEAVMVIPITAGGAPNAAGYTRCRGGAWWHAVDLIGRHWRDLLNTRRFTTPECIAQAVAHGLHVRSPKFGLAEAHTVMRALGAKRPADRQALLRCFMAPALVRPETGASGKQGPGRWPVNHAIAGDKRALAWSMIVGFESGWLHHDRSGYAEWTPAGRDAYARRGSPPAAPGPAPAGVKPAPAPPQLGGEQFDLFA